MEPVTVTRKVRRTVRMAVALVVGQALLCAFIGWLTFSRSSPAEHGRDSAAVDRMAVPPPMAVPPTATARPSASKAQRPPPASSAPARKLRPSRSRVAPDPPVRTTVPARPRPATPTPSPEIILLPPAPPQLPAPAWPTPPAGGLFQQPVTVGEECWPEGAFGRTPNGAVVRCDGDRHRRPRWKIV